MIIKKILLVLLLVKNWSFNYVWFLNKIYFFLIWRLLGFNFLLINNVIVLMFDRNIGFVCFGSICVLVCFFLINFKYFLIKEDVVGFLVFEIIF